MKTEIIEFLKEQGVDIMHHTSDVIEALEAYAEQKVKEATEEKDRQIELLNKRIANLKL